MDAFQNGSPAMPITNHYKPTASGDGEYDTVDPTFVISITSDKQSPTDITRGRSDSAAGNYEEPMVLRSGSIGNGVEVSRRYCSGNRSGVSAPGSGMELI